MSKKQYLKGALLNDSGHFIPFSGAVRHLDTQFSWSGCVLCYKKSGIVIARSGDGTILSLKGRVNLLHCS